MAQSSTRRRRSSARARRNSTTRSATDLVNVAVPRPVANAIETASRATRNAFAAFRNYLLESATSEIESAQRMTASTSAPPATGPAQPRRQRGRPRSSANAAPQRRTTGGRRTEIVDSLRRCLPAVGQQTSLKTLVRDVSRDLKRKVRPQDIGQALNRLPNGMVNRIGRDTIETTRLAA